MTDCAAAHAPPSLSLSDAKRISDIAERMAGIRIGAAKRDFLSMRASRRLRALGCADFSAYMAILETDPDEPQRLLETLTTHTTAFFREPAHFDWLRTHGLEALTRAGVGRERPLHIWSAAASTGAEMWSAAMTVDAFALASAPGLDWALLGTDVSRSVLRRAAQAVFTEPEIEAVPEAMRRRHLLRSKRRGADGRSLYRIAPTLRARARLAYANLMRLDAAPEWRADVIDHKPTSTRRIPAWSRT